MTTIQTMSDLTARIFSAEDESPAAELARLRKDVEEQTAQIITLARRNQQVEIERARLLAALRYYADPAHSDGGLRARAVLSRATAPQEAAQP